MLVREPPFPHGGTWGRGAGVMGALIRTANQFQHSDFPTPRGYEVIYEQAVHPLFNYYTEILFYKKLSGFAISGDHGRKGRMKALCP